MAKFASAAFLDGGLDYAKANIVDLVLLKAYTAGDSIATIAGNVVATVSMATGDFTKSSSGNNRVLTSATKSGTASANSGASPNLHFAFRASDGSAIWATDETSDQVITSGNPVNFPALTYTVNQPT